MRFTPDDENDIQCQSVDFRNGVQSHFSQSVQNCQIDASSSFQEGFVLSLVTFQFSCAFLLYCSRFSRQVKMEFKKNDLPPPLENAPPTWTTHPLWKEFSDAENDFFNIDEKTRGDAQTKREALEKGVEQLERKLARFFEQGPPGVKVSAVSDYLCGRDTPCGRLTALIPLRPGDNQGGDQQPRTFSFRGEQRSMQIRVVPLHSQEALRVLKGDLNALSLKQFNARLDRAGFAAAKPLATPKSNPPNRGRPPVQRSTPLPQDCSVM